MKVNERFLFGFIQLVCSLGRILHVSNAVKGRSTETQNFRFTTVSHCIHETLLQNTLAHKHFSCSATVENIHAKLLCQHLQNHIRFLRRGNIIMDSRSSFRLCAHRPRVFRLKCAHFLSATARFRGISCSRSCGLGFCF